MLQIFRKNTIKNQHTGSFLESQSRARGPPPGAQAPSRRALGWGRAKGAPGPLVAPWLPPFPIYSLSRETSEALSRLCFATAALPRSGAPADLFPAPCRRVD